MMDPNVMEERVRSLSNMTKLQSGVLIGVGTITVSMVVALIAMFYLTTTQLSDLNGAIVSLETRIDSRIDSLEAKFAGLEAKFAGLETKFASLETKFASLETKFDTEIATRQ